MSNHLFIELVREVESLRDALSYQGDVNNRIIDWISFELVLIKIIIQRFFIVMAMILIHVIFSSFSSILLHIANITRE